MKGQSDWRIGMFFSQLILFIKLDFRRQNRFRRRMHAVTGKIIINKIKGVFLPDPEPKIIIHTVMKLRVQETDFFEYFPSPKSRRLGYKINYFQQLAGTEKLKQ